jgi:TonB-linked SusC/RagA family outer membrane protein
MKGIYSLTLIKNQLLIFLFMRKTITFLFIFLLSGMSIAFAQNAIRGTVTDKSGAPLPGVTVKVKGTQNGTQTDANGHYSVNAESNSTLIFSYIGYVEQQVPVNGRSSISITMADASTNLNEVVVVGFGTQKKAQVTGAIAHVTAADLQDQQNVRVDDALQGRAAGVTVVQQSGSPGAQPTVLIRGVGSINNPSPLFVIDGVVVDNGGYENLNPNDIATIDVLKDASAAIYGSRAANGVVLITTKKGTAGEPKLDYNMYIGSQGRMHKVPLANASQYETLRNEAVTNDGGTAPFANASSAGTGTDWQDQIFDDHALIQNHNLSLSGASDKASYYTSFGYMDQNGLIDPAISYFKRYTFTVNTSYKLKSYLKIGENFSYAYIRDQNIPNANNTFGAPLSSALNLDPLTPTVVTDINSQPNASVYNSEAAYLVRNGQGLPYGISKYVAQEITNPLAYTQTQLGNYGWAQNLMGNVYAELTPIAGLTIRSQLSGKQAFYGNQSFTPLYYLNASTSNTSNVSEYRESDRNFVWNFDNTANYTRAFGEHHLSVLVGTSAEAHSAVGLNTTYNQLPINNYTQQSFNYSLPAANRIGGANEGQPYTLASYFGRVTYDYNEKYLFSGVIRRDGSSKFGSNNIYGTFPSVEVGWVVSKENFFPKNSFIDFLKIRASYGAVGNEQSLGTFAYTSIVNGGGNNNYVYGSNGLVTGYATSSPANPDLKWESAHNGDIGFDALIANDWNVTFDWYKRVTTGMLEQPTLPGYAGFSSSPWANVGNLENNGFEVELGYNHKFGDMRINVTGNIGYNHNEVTSLGTTAYYNNGSWQGAGGYAPERTAVGHQVSSFYGFNELGVFHSQAEINSYTHNGQMIQPNAKPGDIKWADLNGDGKIDANDRMFLGDPIPHWTYGATLALNYKAFDLKAFAQGVWGNKIFQAYRRLDVQWANYSTAALNAWTPQNPNSNYPRLTDADPNKNFSVPSNLELQSGAYFRLKTLELGYTLPKAILSKADIHRVRIFVSSTNLFTLTKYTGYDPEVGLPNNSSAQSGIGIDYGVYPQARTLSIGADVTL